MKRQATKKLMFTSCVSAVALLAGCSSEQSAPVATAEEIKAFKGGPMPPEARRGMEKAMAESAAKRAAQAGQPAAQTPAQR